MRTPKRISDITVCSNGIISFECTSEMYGTTDAGGKAADALKNGFVSLGDGCDYVLNEEDKAEIKKQIKQSTKELKMITAMGNSLEILKTETFVDNAKIVDKFGQGSNRPTGKCVDGYQVDFDIKVSLKSGESKKFHIVFQSLDRSDNLRAYGSCEMSTAGKYGCDEDSEELLDFTDDKEIIEILENKAEKLCKEWFDNNVESEDLEN